MDLFVSFRLLRRSFSWGYQFPKELLPKQVPILLRISDYSKRLETEDITLQEYITQQFARLYPNLPNIAEKLLNELVKGRCLLLLDGLDEVANDRLRGRVAQAIHRFTSDYSASKPKIQYHNRFII